MEQMPLATGVDHEDAGGDKRKPADYSMLELLGGSATASFGMTT